MAKVVLVWNEHPTETVAGHHARNCAKLLRAMGHEVILEKNPVNKTAFGIAREGTPRQAANRLKDEILKGTFAPGAVLEKYHNKHDATVFSFHSASPEVLGKAETAEAKDFDVGPLSGWWPFHYPHEILYIPFKGNYDVEVPAVDHELSAEILKKTNTRIEEIKKIAKDRSVDEQLYWGRHTLLNKMRQPEQQKFLDPIITRKIADAIHEIISNKAPGSQKANS